MPPEKPGAKPSQPPRVSVMESALDPELLKRLKVGADSREALQKASGGVVERMGRRSLDNAFILNIDGRRFVYARVQDQGGTRIDNYRTDGLRRSLDPAGRFKGHDLDHVASARIEGGRMGNRFALLAMVQSAVNRSHGATNERGPAPTREFNKTAPPGLNASGKGHSSGWTREMFMKMSGRKSDGNGRSMLRDTPSKEALAHAQTALLQSPDMQVRLARLSDQGRAFEARAAKRSGPPPSLSPKPVRASVPRVSAAPVPGAKPPTPPPPPPRPTPAVPRPGPGPGPSRSR
ncbi:hypothetical protein SAMN05216567_11418 [Variovorax sp. OK605]|uniref:hypothetical protein n=1 Tax=Variovorax sp. OK605 TaxID=1855317 RepID=UPI0008E30FE0|nr:hypothetical protein [Variovorax sp. OK605]SFQ32761.1 hypothetical protein SAMN05216567_11418 [Variovorax sp. OK605]